jgi:hypothetical protein
MERNGPRAPVPSYFSFPLVLQQPKDLTVINESTDIRLFEGMKRKEKREGPSVKRRVGNSFSEILKFLLFAVSG